MHPRSISRPLRTLTALTAAAVAATSLAGTGVASASPLGPDTLSFGPGSGSSSTTSTPPSEHTTVSGQQTSGVNVGLGGAAYGTYAYSSGKTYVSGPIGYADLGCVGSAGIRKKADAASTDLGPFGRAGATETTVRTFAKGGWKGVASRNHIAGARLLGGLIELGALTSDSSARTNGKQYVAHNDSKLASLRIGGRPIDISAKPNSKIAIELPGLGSIGTIELNKQFAGWQGQEFRVHTEAVHITILKDNPLGLKIGSTLRFGVSGVRITKPVVGLLTGKAFATKASIGGKLIGHGPTSWATLPCKGGAKSANVAEADVPNLLKTGAAKSTTSGRVSGGTAGGVVSNSIAKVSILGGLISADALEARVSGRRVGGPYGVMKRFTTFSDAGTKFATLRVAGHPVIDVDVAPNTTINVLGLGKVTLRKTVREKNRLSVTMVDITISNPDLGLPVGAKVEVGHAGIGILR